MIGLKGIKALETNRITLRGFESTDSESLYNSYGADTEIININTNSRLTTYTLQNIDDTYYFSVFPYSKESDFFSNNYGATTELKLGKKVYIDLDKDKNIISISNKDGILIFTLI